MQEGAKRKTVRLNNDDAIKKIDGFAKIKRHKEQKIYAERGQCTITVEHSRAGDVLGNG